MLLPNRLGSSISFLYWMVLYHLPDMMRALAIVRSVCSGALFIESHYARDVAPEVSAARYYRDRTLNNDLTNFDRQVLVACATCYLTLDLM